MSQIFLSYSSIDRDRVMPLVEALQADGYSVWWDREIRPGPSFDREIEREIAEAGCIVVVWSENSVDSEWVRAEVEEGARRGLLVPVMIDDVLPPLAHRRRQAANLSDWDGEHDGEYAKLITGIEATLAGEQPAVEASEPGRPHGAAPSRRRRRRALGPLLGATALVSLAVGAGLATLLLAHDHTPQKPPVETKFEIQLPPGLGLTNNVGYPVMITPNGRTIVFNATDQAGRKGTHYFSRSLGTLAAHAVDGVESHQVTGLGSLWRGPNGEWFLYNDPIARVYKKERIAGGAPIPIANTNLSAGGVQGLDWSLNGDIVFSNSSSPEIMIVKGGAGKAMPLTHPPDGMVDMEPHFTPDGDAVVYDEVKKGKNATDNNSQVMILVLNSGKSHQLLQGSEPRVTADGHLLFRRQNILWATAFDSKRLAVYGKQVPIVEGLTPSISAWDVADNGTLVYVPASTGGNADTHMVWLSADGKTEPVPSFQHIVEAPALSPDNTRLAVMSSPDASTRQASIWVYSFDKEIASRLTFNKNLAALPAWSPDGKWIVYVQGDPATELDLMLRAADGTGDAVQLTRGANSNSDAFTPDGRSVVFSSCNKQCDIARVGADGKAPFKVMLKTRFNERAPTVSPDGRWIAYQSDESGQDEVFVRPWPDIENGRWQVSSSSGDAPVWSRDGSTLFYVEPASNTLMAVAIGNGRMFSAGRPTQVVDFSGYRWQNGAGGPNFAVARDGKRFLVIKSTPKDKIVVVLHWLAEVERLVPTGH